MPNDDENDRLYLAKMAEAKEQLEKDMQMLVLTQETEGNIPDSSAVPNLDIPVVYQPAPARDLAKMSDLYQRVNRMTCEQLRTELREMRLDLRGHKSVLVNRLKRHCQQARLRELAKNEPHGKKKTDRLYDYLLVIDFECTCEDKIFDYEHEIIEFPVVILSTKTLCVVDEFHSYVKPLLHPKLSEFCSNLTGITQEQVDKSRTFPGVVDNFLTWLAEWEEKTEKAGTAFRWAFVSDGPWDLGKFFQMQCYQSGYDSVPHTFRHWINIRRSFNTLFLVKGIKKKEWKNLSVFLIGNNGIFDNFLRFFLRVRPLRSGMLTALGLKFEGREHSGLDDAKNIARIAVEIIKLGFELRVNEHLMRCDYADNKLAKMHNDYQNKVRASCGKFPAFLPNQTDNRTLSPEPELSQEDKERRFWREHLPYKVMTINKQEFQLGTYLDCDTCNEEEEEETGQN